MNISTFNAFIIYAIRMGFKAENKDKSKYVFQLTTPDGEEKYDVTLYRYHGYIYTRKEGIFEGVHNCRLHNLKQAKNWIDVIVNEIELDIELDREEEC